MVNKRTKRILVNGGNSFVGNYLVDFLLQTTLSVIIVCSRKPVQKKIISSRVFYENADLLDKESYETIFTKYLPDQVFHLAAVTRLSDGEENPENTINTNFFGTKLITDLCVEHKVNALLSVSSNLARNPKSVVGLSKYFSEIYLRKKGNSNTKIISLRLPNVPDSPGSVTPLFKRQIKNGGPITITHPDMERRFVSNEEASHLLVTTMNTIENSNVIVITKENTKITDLAINMIKESGKYIEIKYIGMKAGEKLIEEKYENNEIIKTENSLISILKNDWNTENINLAFEALNLKSNTHSFQSLINKLKLSLQQ
jgi:FlaA1/EpsC-like NDP-sugar epimerase